jgi:hypothetical protein
MPRLTGTVAFALVTVLLTAASQQPTTPSPVRTGTQSSEAAPVPAFVSRDVVTSVPVVGSVAPAVGQAAPAPATSDAQAAGSASAACPDLPVGGFGAEGVQARDGVVDGCHTITAQAGNHLIRVDPQTHWQWTVRDQAGIEICDHVSSGSACAFPSPGTYSLLVTAVRAAAVPYRAGVVRLDGTTGCAAPIAVGFDDPAINEVLPPPMQVNCHVIDANQEDRLLPTFLDTLTPVIADSVRAWVVNGAGTRQCIAGDYDPCVLDGPGPYRLIVSTTNSLSDGLSYQARVPRLNGATGCPEVSPSAYGTVAGQPAGLNCRTLHIPAAGDYIFKMVNSRGGRTWGTIFDAAGGESCFPFSNGTCAFPAAGTYTAVTTPGDFADLGVQHSTALVPAAPTEGCVDISDQGTSTYRGSFTQPGEIDCLRLPSQAGAILTVALPDDAGEVTPALEGLLVNAEGTSLCAIQTMRGQGCRVRGPAPFHLILSPAVPRPTGAYSISVIRVDGAANGCKVLPFGDPGLTVTLDRTRNIGCLTIPAGAQVIHWRRLTGSGDTRIRVFDATGMQRCYFGPPAVVGELSCTIPAGTATVVLVPDDAAAKYRVSLRAA